MLHYLFLSLKRPFWVLVLAVFLVSCYVTDQRSIHKKPEGPIKEDIFEYKSYEQLDKDLSKKLKFEGRYRRDYDVDKASLPTNGMVVYKTRKPEVSLLSIQFEKFNQKCAYKETKEFVSKEKGPGNSSSGGVVSGAGIDGYNYAAKTVVNIESVFTFTCKPQLKISRPTKVFVLDSAETPLKEYTIKP